MTPGPTYVIRCPLCEQLGRYSSIASGNTFGAVYYTDGKRVAPMLPDTSSVVRCGHCSGVFWLESAADVGEYSPWGRDAKPIDPTWAAALCLVEPDERQDLANLEQLMTAQPKSARDVRLFTWWRGNDRQRGERLIDDDATAELISTRHDNMRALIDLLDTAEPVDQLMRAEVLRQLGEFELATKALTRHFPAEFDTAISRLLYLCARRDSALQKL